MLMYEALWRVEHSTRSDRTNIQKWKTEKSCKLQHLHKGEKEKRRRRRRKKEKNTDMNRTKERDNINTNQKRRWKKQKKVLGKSKKTANVIWRRVKERDVLHQVHGFAGQKERWLMLLQKAVFTIQKSLAGDDRMGMGNHLKTEAKRIVNDKKESIYPDIFTPMEWNEGR